MKIGFVAIWPPNDVKYWSGTPYHSYHALNAASPDVALISTCRFDAALSYANKVTTRLFGWDLLREPATQWLYRAMVDRQIRAQDVDVVVSVGASHKLCKTRANTPIVHVSDALFSCIVGAYSNLSKYTERTKKLGHELQEAFLEKTDALCLTSDWALESAETNYDLSDCKVRMIPLGANLEADPGATIASRTTCSPLKLLFVGGDWQRKGGPLLIDAFRIIRDRFPKAELHVVGCTPTIDGDMSGIHLHGFLHKSDLTDMAKLDQLFKTSSLLVQPSRQEANAVVFAEACAYGLPIVATKTGGIATSVVHDENGLLLPLEAGPGRWAEAVCTLWDDTERHARLAQGARHRFETVLSWEAWATSILAEAKALSAARDVRAVKTVGADDPVLVDYAVTRAA